MNIEKQKQLEFLNKAKENNEEIIELAEKIIELSNIRGDHKYARQVESDLIFLHELNNKFLNEIANLKK